MNDKLQNALLLVNDLGISCIFALEHNTEKKAYLHMTSNLLRALERINRNLGASRKDFRLNILEEINGAEEQRLRMNYWCDEYTKRGYSYPTPKFSKCQVIIEIESLGTGVDYYALVKIKNRHGTKKIVGAFKKINEARAFIDKYYSSGILVTTVYATNQDTKDYVKKIQREAQKRFKMKQHLKKICLK